MLAQWHCREKENEVKCVLGLPIMGSLDFLSYLSYIGLLGGNMGFSFVCREAF